MPLSDKALPYQCASSYLFSKMGSAVLESVPGWYLLFMVISTTSHGVSFKSMGSGVWLLHHIGVNSQVTSYT